MRHHFQKGKTTVAGLAKLVSIWRDPIGRNNKIVLAPYLEARLKVSLVGKHLLKPADMAERDRSSTLTNGEVILRLARDHVRPTATNKARLNIPNFKRTKAHWALLAVTHGSIREAVGVRAHSFGYLFLPRYQISFPFVICFRFLDCQALYLGPKGIRSWAIPNNPS